MGDTSKVLRERFWRDGGPPLSPGIVLTRLEPLVFSRPGPGGSLVVDKAELRSTSGEIRLVVAFAVSLTPRKVPGVAARLHSIVQELRGRAVALRDLKGRNFVPTIVVESASKGLLEACLAAGIALLDTTGTVAVRTQGLVVHIEGAGAVRRAKRAGPNPFTGKAVRVVRQLLIRAHAGNDEPRSVQAIASATDTSYSYAHGILTALEEEGLVFRRTPRSGFRAKDPVRLLQAWIESRNPTADAVKGYYAPSTKPETLAKSSRGCLERSGNVPIWSLASGLRREETYVAGIPHGAYYPGDPSPLIDSLKLRSTTPHNFHLLAVRPEEMSSHGGILDGTRELDWGRGVALPQLVIDFSHSGGRGREQANFLVQKFAEETPLVGAEQNGDE